MENEAINNTDDEKQHTLIGVSGFMRQRERTRPLTEVKREVVSDRIGRFLKASICCTMNAITMLRRIVQQFYVVKDGLVVQ